MNKIPENEQALVARVAECVEETRLEWGVFLATFLGYAETFGAQIQKDDFDSALVTFARLKVYIRKRTVEHAKLSDKKRLRTNHLREFREAKCR